MDINETQTGDLEKQGTAVLWNRDGKHERIVKMCERPKFTVHLAGVRERK